MTPAPLAGPGLPRPLPFARAALLAFTILIVYASWYPFSGWHANSLALLRDTLLQWPYYWTVFDALTNVLAYLPFGLLSVWSLYPRRHPLSAVLLASLAGSLLSTGMECGQFFLSSRVTSSMDIATNALGSFLGALAGQLLARPVLEKGRLKFWQKAWLHRESSQELLLLALWPAAQLYPHAFLFGLGQFWPWLIDGLAPLLELPDTLLPDLGVSFAFSAQAYVLAEALITALGCAGALMTLLYLLNRHAPKVRLCLLLLGTALASKALALAVLFSPDMAWTWLTPGAVAGLALAALMLYGFSFAPGKIQRRLALLLLLVQLLVINLIPSQPYFAATLHGWVQGKFLNFNGAAQFLNLAWPGLALWIIGRRPWRGASASPAEPAP